MVITVGEVSGVKQWVQLVVHTVTDVLSSLYESDRWPWRLVAVLRCVFSGL